MKTSIVITTIRDDGTPFGTELDVGETAQQHVLRKFNPTDNPKVDATKTLCAAIIQQMIDLRESPDATGAQKRAASIRRFQGSTGSEAVRRSEPMTQLDLPYVAGSSTSKAAAKSMESSAPTLKARVFAYIEGHGILGATDEEMQSGIPMAANTQRPRRRELELEGRIEDAGKTRSTASGRQAVIWKAKV